ncbi:MAG TPA: hypothetical protein VL651_15775 [Bacteroidia bacterium]|jgi:hypothetical protein|nr:hypothetical protein [Bacteroidia bacterium]
MKKPLFIAFLFVLLVVCTNAQNNTRIAIDDTVVQGYYLPLDSNVVSMDILIISPAAATIEYRFNGDQLPASILFTLTHLGKGTKVFYTEITVSSNGILYKRPAYGYIIGVKNTTPGAI